VCAYIIQSYTMSETQLVDYDPEQSEEVIEQPKKVKGKNTVNVAEKRAKALANLEKGRATRLANLKKKKEEASRTVTIPSQYEDEEEDDDSDTELVLSKRPKSKPAAIPKPQKAAPDTEIYSKLALLETGQMELMKYLKQQSKKKVATPSISVVMPDVPKTKADTKASKNIDDLLKSLHR
jgi:hypothetical protein